MGTRNHKVLSFVSFLYKTWPLFCTASQFSRSLGAGSCSWLSIEAPVDNRLRSWDPQLQDCPSLRSPSLWTSASTIRLFAQKIPEEHFRRIGLIWFSSQTQVPLFGWEPEALDPEVPQVFPACMLEVPPGCGLYLPLQTPFSSWYPSHTAKALFMSRKIYYKSFAFPASMIFNEGQKYVALRVILCIVHAMFSLYSQRWVLGSLVITEVSPWLKVLILHRWGWFQSHFPTWSPATYSQFFLLSVSSDLFWINCSATTALFKVTLEAIHGETSHSAY